MITAPQSDAASLGSRLNAYKDGAGSLPPDELGERADSLAASVVRQIIESDDRVEGAPLTVSTLQHAAIALCQCGHAPSDVIGYVEQVMPPAE